jgi:hypothetical protein
MIYKLNNHSEDVLNMDNVEVFQYIVAKYEKTEADDDEVLTLMKDVTRDPKKLHEIAVETQVSIYDILRIIVIEMPEIVDKRFLTRMRKLYNTKM